MLMLALSARPTLGAMLQSLMHSSKMEADFVLYPVRGSYTSSTFDRSCMNGGIHMNQSGEPSGLIKEVAGPLEHPCCFPCVHASASRALLTLLKASS